MGGDPLGYLAQAIRFLLTFSLWQDRSNQPAAICSGFFFYFVIPGYDPESTWIPDQVRDDAAFSIPPYSANK